MCSFVLVCWFVFAFTLTCSLPNVYSLSVHVVLSVWQEMEVKSAGGKITKVNETNKQIIKKKDV